MNAQTMSTMHVSLQVASVQSTVDFYESLFGQAPAKVKPGYAKFELEQPGLVISFVEQTEGESSPSFGHLGIRVASESALKRYYDRVKSAGLQTIEEAQTRCCYALQDKFWVADPDGHRWEVYYFHEDSEWNDPAYQQQGANEQASGTCASTPAAKSDTTCC